MRRAISGWGRVGPEAEPDEGLTRYGKDYQVEPALAAKWTAISPTQVRFELRKGDDRPEARFPSVK